MIFYQSDILYWTSEYVDKEMGPWTLNTDWPFTRAVWFGGEAAPLTRLWRYLTLLTMFRILGHFLPFCMIMIQITFENNMKPSVSNLPHCHCFLHCSKKNPMDGSGFVADFLTLDFSRFSLLQCDAFCFLLRLERKSLLCGFSHPFTPHQSHQKEWRKNINLNNQHQMF